MTFNGIINTNAATVHGQSRVNMTRDEIVAVFDSIADILQIKGEIPEKVKTYRNLAITLMPSPMRSDHLLSKTICQKFMVLELLR
jgi:hypothetical protein